MAKREKKPCRCKACRRLAHVEGLRQLIDLYEARLRQFRRELAEVMR